MLIAIVVSLLSGVTIVVARTINARLALETSVMKSTIYNYATGFAVSLVILLALSLFGSRVREGTGPAVWWAYLGGAVGVFVIILSNVTVARISSFYMTLLLFIGQVFAGIVLDMALSGVFSPGHVIGGLLVAVGFGINVRVDAGSGGDGEEEH